MTQDGLSAGWGERTYREKRPLPSCRRNASVRRDGEPAGSIVGGRAAAASRCWRRTSRPPRTNREQPGKTYPALPAAPVAVAAETGDCRHLRWPRCLAVAVGGATARPPIRTTNAGPQRSSPYCRAVTGESEQKNKLKTQRSSSNQNSRESPRFCRSGVTRVKSPDLRDVNKLQRFENEPQNRVTAPKMWR